MINDLENTETFLPDDMEPLYRLRIQLDQVIQLAEYGQIKKLSPADMEIRRKNPQILGEIGDFEIRWRSNSVIDSDSEESRKWRLAVLSALGWLDLDPARAKAILRRKLND